MMRLIAIIGLFLLVACSSSSHHQVVLPNQVVKVGDWPSAHNDDGLAVKTFSKNAHMSTHLLSLNGREKPHYHDHHDLMAYVVSGQVAIHFDDHHQVLKQGDTVMIPKATYHWAENVEKNGSHMLVVFTPPFDPKDRRFLE